MSSREQNSAVSETEAVAELHSDTSGHMFNLKVITPIPAVLYTSTKDTSYVFNPTCL